MSCFVFLGPTLSHEAARAELDATYATYLPPAAQGDVLRAAKERPFAIGIVDGYFERLPAVWHKEILWALSRGIHVFGAASMGALRAAELATFGMQGVGEIFEAFRSGALEDDDEVAVAHGEASAGYRATSEAMVNIRATVRRAEQVGAVSAAVRKRIETLAKGMFYPERSYPRILARALEEGAPGQEVEALRAFLASIRVDQKRADAVALLGALRACCQEARPATPTTFSFAHTEAWQEVVDWADTQPPLDAGSAALPSDLLASEVRLMGWRGQALLAEGMNRVAAGVLARRAGVADREQRAAAVDQSLRRASAAAASEPVPEPESPGDGQGQDRFGRWLAERGLSAASYPGFVDRNVDLGWLRERYRDEVDRHVVDQLRLTEEYAPLSERARRKQRLLAEHGLEEPTLEDVGIDLPGLLAWYFEERLGRPVPGELESYLAEAGIADRRGLEREALRELVYVRRSAPPDGG